MNIAVIPARGGSKRIPRKNIKECNGKPAISYAIKAAFESQVFSEVIVSTIQVIEGEDKDVVSKSWSGGTAVVVSHAIKDLVASGSASTSVVRFK